MSEKEIESQIQSLQDIKLDLKNKLKMIENSQDLQLKKLCELMGMTDDFDKIPPETPEELEKIQERKESLSKIESQAKKNQDLQKKILDNKNMLEKIKKFEFQTQEIYMKKVIDLKDHLQRLKDELVTMQLNSKYYEQEKVDSKSEELIKMVENSKNLISLKIFSGFNTFKAKIIPS